LHCSLLFVAQLGNYGSNGYARKKAVKETLIIV